MELRCLDCICAGCDKESTCTLKGCYGDEDRSPFECTDVLWSCPLEHPEDYS